MEERLILQVTHPKRPLYTFKHKREHIDIHVFVIYSNYYLQSVEKLQSEFAEFVSEKSNTQQVSYLSHYIYDLKSQSTTWANNGSTRHRDTHIVWPCYGDADKWKKELHISV